MNTSLKLATLQAYRLLVYRRALHPELFDIKGQRRISHGEYDFEAWIMPGAHCMRFQHDGQCGTELVTYQDANLPERGLETTIPCAGEKDHEQELSESINFMATVQTETLPQNLYESTYRELVEFGEESEALMQLWTEPDGGLSASILDIQRFRREVHAQSYHLIANSGLVLRTQTIFEHKHEDDDEG